MGLTTKEDKVIGAVPVFDQIQPGVDLAPQIAPIADRQPAGVQNAMPNALTWTHDPNVLWYQLWLGTADYQTQMMLTWVNALEICADSICTVPVTGITTDRAYEWWIEAWGPGDYTNWIENGGVGFTVTSSTLSRQ